MAGTHYGALNFTLEEEKKPQGSLRKAGAIAAVVVAVSVMFFAGRVHKSMTTPFTHEDVMNVASTCQKGQFIGLCKACSPCAAYQFENGGCTWFKDTFCSYCDPIAHCNRVNQRCTDSDKKKVDTTCTVCDCDDPITAYDQKTLEEIEYYHRSWKKAKVEKYKGKKGDEVSKREAQKMVYSCYFNGGQPWSPKTPNPNPFVKATTCKACTVCPTNYYQPKENKKTGQKDGACDPAKHKDTTCLRCRVCKDFEYTKTKCTYFENTQCGKCLNCDQESVKQGKFLWQSSRCSSANNKNVYEVGNAGRCTPCSTGAKRKNKFYVSKSCKPGNYKYDCKQDTHANKRECGWLYKGGAMDTVFADCDGCRPGQYIGSPCDKGIAGRRGEKTKDCKPTFNKDTTKNCGPFRDGANDVCEPCKVNRGCDKTKGGEDCALGQFLDTTGKTTNQLRNYRTRVCDNTKDYGGDAQYDVCKNCKAYEFQKRNCAAECAVVNAAGTCKGRGWSGKEKVCQTDADCGAGFCDECSLKERSGTKIGSTEEGDMVENRLGTQTYCSACPNKFVAGKDAHGDPEVRPSNGLATLCPAKYKTCAYAPKFSVNGKLFNNNKDGVNANGMTLPPAYSTCDGQCPFKKDANQAYYKKQKNNFENCCDKGALGPACEWQRFNKQCRTPFVKDGQRQGMPYRKRTKKTGGYKGFRPKGLTKQGTRKRMIKADVGSHVFVRWCKQLCEDFPSCSMFQVERCLVDGTCPVVDGTLCDLFKGTNSAASILADKPAPLSELVLKKIKKTPNDWTCEQGFSVRHNHQGFTSEWGTAGFDCGDADMRGVKKNTKCGTALCSGAAAKAKCCEQNKQLCFTKPQAMRDIQNARR